MLRLLSHSLRATLFLALLAPGVLTAAVSSPRTLQVQIIADDMCCQGCVQKVAAQLYALPGVTSVQGDVPKRLVTLTAKPSSKLTLERIWQAVDKANGGPSKLISHTSTYTLTRAESLKPEERLPTGRYLLEVEALENNDDAKSIADELRRIPGVERIGVDLARRRLAIDTPAHSVLSPWVLISAAECAHRQAIAVSGPFGVLAIERAAVGTTAATAQLDRSRNTVQNQGEVR